MRLHECLDDASRATEVSVDLERWVVVEQIGQRRLRQQRAQIVIDRLAVAQTREEIDQPRAAPARVSATVGEAEIKRFSRGVEQLRRDVAGELRARMQAEEMRDVTVPGLGLAEGARPFHQSSVCADLGPRELRARLLDARDERVLVVPKHRRGIEQVREHIPHDLLVHRVAHADVRVLPVGGDERVLRRRARARHQLVRHRILDEVVEVELRRATQHRPRAFAQEGLVARVRVVLPEMPRKPAAAVRPHAPHRVADRLSERPCVAGVVRNEALHLVEFFRGNTANFGQALSEVEEWLVALGEVRALSVPVVHLDVDVDVVIGAPRRGEVLVPQSL